MQNPTLTLRKIARLANKRLLFRYKDFCKLPRLLKEEIACGGFIPSELLSLRNLRFSGRQGKEIIKEADKICRHKIQIFGMQISLGHKINWHKDFWSGRVWDKGYYGGLDYEDIYDSSDVKVPWELSRLHHFLALAFAYRITKDERYAGEFRGQFLDWKNENPVAQGINWLVSMEAAIRAVNLCIAYSFFRNSKLLDRGFWQSFFELPYAHGNFIFSNLEWSIANENHYLSDLLGLLALGIFFRNKRWKQFALNGLEKEIANQVREGVQYEASINYHRFCTEIFLLAYIFCLNNSILLSQSFKGQLEKMLEFIMGYTKPNSLAPSIGDSDDGRILAVWNKNPLMHNGLLAVGAVLFNRKDFKYYGSWNDKLGLLVSKKEYNGVKQEHNKVKLQKVNSALLASKRFNGFYIMRNEDCYLIAHCGDIGRNGYGGHGHNDLLSFELNIRGDDLVIDPGTYVYTADAKMRNMFRSTAYHNTLAVEGREQNIIRWEEPFRMGHKSKAKCLRFETGDKFDCFIGEHYGFSPLIHRREIKFDKKGGQFIINDYLINKKEADNLNIENGMENNGTENKRANKGITADCSLYLHLAPELKIRQLKDKIIINNKYALAVKDYAIKDGFISNAYYSKTPAKIVEYKFSGNPTTIRIYKIRV